ncbi:MAG: ABC transporter ATP-binding protein, partial [Reinekea sp.]
VCFGLLGPNGAGKTTTIEMLEGIQQPTSGQIFLFGQLATKALFERVGIQFQNTALPDYLKVAETIRMFASFYQHSMDFDRLVDLCALGELLKADTRKLSGGQRQRLLLALALVNDPDLLFLDEPTTGLDPQARRQFWELINSIKAQGKSIVLTTHYMDEAQSLCDEVVIMDRGRLIEHGSPQALLQMHFQGVLVQLPKANLQGKSCPLEFNEKNGLVEVLTERVDVTLQQLIALHIPLEGMQIKQANLEDLFLKLTGHALRG